MGFMESVFGEEWKVVKETDEKVIMSNGKKIVPVSITGGGLNYNTKLHRLPRKDTEKVQRIIDLRNARIG